jgi:hypothetical protein
MQAFIDQQISMIMREAHMEMNKQLREADAWKTEALR